MDWIKVSSLELTDYLASARRVFHIEAEAVAALSSKLGVSISRAVDRILHSHVRIIGFGMGKSGISDKKIASCPSTYKKLDKRSALYKTKRKIEKAKAQVRAKGEHRFRVIKRQFGYVMTRFRGPARARRNWLRCSPCRNCGWRFDIYWRTLERCVCNAGNSCSAVLAAASSA